MSQKWQIGVKHTLNKTIDEKKLISDEKKRAVNITI